MIRNSTRYVSYKDLKEIYSTSNEEEGLLKLDDFGQKWDSKYPMIHKSWLNYWDNLSEFFFYPEEIRKIIYATNAIESLNASLRKVTKNRTAFLMMTQFTKSCILQLIKSVGSGPCQ